jgi:hypothetical protein
LPRFEANAGARTTVPRCRSCNEGIGECLLAVGDTGQGATHLREALETFQRLGMRAAVRRVSARLADLTPA